jgi:hypothetical protein
LGRAGPAGVTNIFRCRKHLFTPVDSLERECSVTRRLYLEVRCFRDADRSFVGAPTNPAKPWLTSVALRGEPNVNRTGASSQARAADPASAARNRPRPERQANRGAFQARTDRADLGAARSTMP